MAAGREDLTRKPQPGEHRTTQVGGLRPSDIQSAEAFGAELDFVYRTFRRMGAQPAEAEDMVQDVFMVVWRRRADFEQGRPLRPWLAGIASHVARGHFRKPDRHQSALQETDQQDEKPSPEDQLAAARARQLVRQALATMPEHQRSVLIRHEFEGASIRELAEELSVPFFTAATRIRRARERFAKAVKQLQGRQRRHLVLLPPLPPRPRFRWPVIAPLLLAAAGLWLLIAGLARAPGQPGAVTSRERAVAVARAPVDRRPLPPPHLVRPAPAGAAVAEAPPAAAAGPTRGLVAAWRFEDGPGSVVAADSSGRGHPCLLHELDPATAWVPGKIGGAVDLGTAGWLECPLPEARAGVPFQLSVAAWVRKVGSLRHRDTVLFTRQLPSGDQRHLFWFGIRDHRITVWSWSWRGWTSSSALTLDDWTHVAFVHSGRDTVLYINGVRTARQDSDGRRGEGLVQSSLTIGAIRFAPDPLRVRQHFDGLVDEALVYDRTLTDAEVAALARR